MSLLAISYPELSVNDHNLIENHRRVNDLLYYEIVQAHFTFVFPVSDISTLDFTNEIMYQLDDIKPISFCIRCAIVHKDSLNEFYHAFLVPDEGFSQMVKLHDKLYSNLLKSHHRLDLDYIPHISIGNSKDVYVIKKMVDKWNSEEFCIKGLIQSIDIISYSNDRINSLEKLHLV